MKKIALVLLLVSVAVLVSCGPSEQEIKKIKSDEDSMSKIDGSIAIDRANQILGDTISAVPDSTEKLDTKAKK